MNRKLGSISMLQNILCIGTQYIGPYWSVIKAILASSLDTQVHYFKYWHQIGMYTCVTSTCFCFVEAYQNITTPTCSYRDDMNMNMLHLRWVLSFTTYLRLISPELAKVPSNTMYPWASAWDSTNSNINPSMTILDLHSQSGDITLRATQSAQERGQSGC